MEEYHFHDPAARDQCATTSPEIAADASGAAGSTGGSPGEVPGMASYVTRHEQIADEDNIKILVCGIDTVDLGIYGHWETDWDALRSFLEGKKQAAQGTNGIHCTTDTGREYLFLPTGKRPQYLFHLQFLEYHIFIAKSEEYRGTPNIYVSFLACAIWHVGIDALLDLLECDLASFGAKIIRIVPSRVDLCVDFKACHPLTKQFLDLHRVSRSQVTDTFENGGKLESFYCGAKSSEVQVTLYDKGLEIDKSNKQWFLSIWDTEDPTDVFRVEFRLRRPFLNKYQINSLDDLGHKLGSIWGYLTAEWFSLRLPDNPESNRRTIHPWWAAIQQYGAERFGQDLGIRRTFKSDNMVPISKILPHILGRTITIAALSGINDRKQSIRHLGELLERFTDDATFSEKYREKCLKLGYRGSMEGAGHDE